MARNPDRPARSRAYRAAEADLGYHAVCMIGYARPVPRDWGDNRGVQPVRIAMSKKPRDAARRPDIESPIHQIEVLDYVLVESEAHARLLKAKLDELLVGTSDESKALRHGWRDLDGDHTMVWPILLEQAVRELTAAAKSRRATSFSVFDEAEKERRVTRRARGRG